MKSGKILNFVSLPDGLRDRFTRRHYRSWPIFSFLQQGEGLKFVIKHRLLVAVFASMAMTGWSQEIIIEAYADGQHSQAFSCVEGRWTESTAKCTAPGLTATKALFNDANTDPAVARFTPEIPADGEYEVFIN